MNWDIKQSFNYQKYMQDFSIHSLLAKILDIRGLEKEDVEKLLSQIGRAHV